MATPARSNQLVLVTCESFHVSPAEGGRFTLELVGAAATDQLPAHREYLTPVQLAQRIKTHPRNIRKLLSHRDNPLPVVRFGGIPRFIFADVQRWANAGKTVSARRAKIALTETAEPSVLKTPKLRRAPRAPKPPKGGCARCEGNAMIAVAPGARGVMVCPDCTGTAGGAR